MWGKVTRIKGEEGKGERFIFSSCLVLNKVYTFRLVFQEGRMPAVVAH